MTVALARPSSRRWPRAGISRTDEENLRLALLAAPASPALQDRLDLGYLTLAAGDRQAALLLLAGVGLELGFSNEAIDWWREIGDDTGLWSVSWVSPVGDRPAFMVDAALADMRAIMATAIAAPAGDRDQEPFPLSTKVMLLDAGDVMGKADAVEAAMNAFLASTTPRVSQLIAAIDGLHRLAALDVSRRVGETAGLLARLVALERLRVQVLIAHEFLVPPLGSPALLDHAARLADAGLGPWFANFPRLVRDDGDMLAWPAAIGIERLPPEWIPQWCILLAVSAPRGRWDALMRGLSRHGMVVALEAALDRLARHPFAADHGGALVYVRTVALERGMAAVALNAQRRIVAAFPVREAERMILADMLALSGEDAEAAAVIEEGLRADPLSPDLLARVRVLQSGDMRTFVTSRGFFGNEEQSANFWCTSFGEPAVIQR